MALITCRDLTLGYDGKEIVRDLSFEVNSGDYLCIVGENGSGKSTLMRTILGLQPPMAGQVLTGDGLLRREIGYLPQQTQIQRDFPASVWEVVLSGCQGGCGLRPYYTRSEQQRARENLARMGLEALAGRCYRELSGGQQQRVLLARALCATRKLLLLDEPVSGLDPKVTGEFYELVQKLNQDSGVSIIMISHDVAAALLYASHILHIGDNLFFGTREEYLRSDIAARFTKGGAEP
ncbi:MAG: metal ABC transporter ATP-binding protein [Oscillospiraceae bacterium]|nr:metal ABC transporter ATP-binding protein [Oscillospiraceae bacterium]